MTQPIPEGNDDAYETAFDDWASMDDFEALPPAPLAPTASANVFATPPPFRILDLDMAEWALRRIRQERRLLEEETKPALDRIATLKGYVEERQRARGRAIERLKGLLTEFHAALVAADAKRLTVKLPDGELRSRAQQPEWSYGNDDELARWLAEEDPDLVKMTLEPKKAELKKAVRLVNEHGRAIERAELDALAPGAVLFVALEGQVVPGVTVTVRPRGFDVVTD